MRETNEQTAMRKHESAEPSNGTVLLAAHGICKFFGTRTHRIQALHDVDMDVREGECVAVIGGSGCGKTTLTRIMFGLDTADAGTVRYRGGLLAGPRSAAMRQLRV